MRLVDSSCIIYSNNLLAHPRPPMCKCNVLPMAVQINLWHLTCGALTCLGGEISVVLCRQGSAIDFEQSALLELLWAQGEKAWM